MTKSQTILKIINENLKEYLKINTVYSDTVFLRAEIALAKTGHSFEILSSQNNSRIVTDYRRIVAFWLESQDVSINQIATKIERTPRHVRKLIKAAIYLQNENKFKFRLNLFLSNLKLS